jgi:hypothetical protein
MFIGSKVITIQTLLIFRLPAKLVDLLRIKEVDFVYFANSTDECVSITLNKGEYSKKLRIADSISCRHRNALSVRAKSMISFDCAM